MLHREFQEHDREHELDSASQNEKAAQTFTIHWIAGKGETICLISLYHFHPLRRHLDISRVISAESSPLHIVSSWT